MRVAYLGDVVGTVGRLALMQAVARLRGEFGAQVVVANAENCAQGSGLTTDQHDKLLACGVDVLTLGDHAFRKSQLRPTLERSERLVRPINLPAGAWGRGSAVVRPGNDDARPAVHVVVVMGRLFMNGPQADDPFAAADAYLASLPRGATPAIVLVEVHAEATSEKVAMGWHLRGRVAGVVGTHTHVPTADARVLPAETLDATLPPPRDQASRRIAPPGQGTAYVTDLGMTGPADSVLGRRADRVLTYMTTGTPAPFDVAEGTPITQGVLIDIDERTGLATAIQRCDLPADRGAPPFAAGR